MSKATKSSKTTDSDQTSMPRRFGSERQVNGLTGISARTLQKDRLLHRKRFPFYKLGGKVLYDLDEVLRIIESTRQGVSA